MRPVSDWRVSNLSTDRSDTGRELQQRRRRLVETTQTQTQEARRPQPVQPLPSLISPLVSLIRAPLRSRHRTKCSWGK